MTTLLTAADSFETTIPVTAVWAALVTPQRWPEVLTDLREGRIDPPGESNEGALNLRARTQSMLQLAETIARERNSPRGR
jgi:hypothetical protein